jgi:hypothetical protein
MSQLIVGVECTKSGKHPIVTVFNFNDREKAMQRAQEWVKSFPEQVPGIYNHPRVRHIGIIEEDMLKDGNVHVLNHILADPQRYIGEDRPCLYK